MKLSAFVAIAAVIGGSFLIPNPAEANDWVKVRSTTNTASYLRLDSRSNGVSYVSSKFYIGDKVALEGHWNVNCKENVMVNENGTEWIKIRGIWRSQEDNMAAPSNVSELYNFACLNK